ncbi:MAG: ABC transporter ATP-binding protein [Huintestinicola sp.]
MSVINVKDVSVKYITGDFKDIGLKEVVINTIKGKNQKKEFWALKNVRFEIEKGELLGIIGKNGAGKSTLLKVITGIMRPTEGTLRVDGTPAALLELASGFDGELTVKENTYLRGALLGYTKEFMNQRYNDIIAFAELEDFQDRPFRQLSSGMKSRLAFSIASLVDPDILILDEVLSVGDGAFKEKSEKKMKSIIESGITTILVSHSLSQIRRMSTKVLWLDKGRQIMFGETDTVCDSYEEFIKSGKLPEEQGENGK